MITQAVNDKKGFAKKKRTEQDMADDVTRSISFGATLCLVPCSASYVA